MRLSKKITLCAILGALSVVLLMLSGLFPIASYAIPAVAGVCLTVVVIEAGRKWAVLTYCLVSLLALGFVLDPIAQAAYVFFFGYYPILKSCIERVSIVSLQWCLKIAVLNASIAICFVVVVRLLKLSVFTEALLQRTPLLLVGCWLVANIAFIVYDILMTKLITLYFIIWRTRFRRDI